MLLKREKKKTFLLFAFAFFLFCSSHFFPILLSLSPPLLNCILSLGFYYGTTESGQSGETNKANNQTNNKHTTS
jgi:hypothetical protein